MPTPREELERLRKLKRLRELEAKAAQAPVPQQPEEKPILGLAAKQLAATPTGLLATGAAKAAELGEMIETPRQDPKQEFARKQIETLRDVSLPVLRAPKTIEEGQQLFEKGGEVAAEQLPKLGVPPTAAAAIGTGISMAPDIALAAMGTGPARSVGRAITPKQLPKPKQVVEVAKRELKELGPKLEQKKALLEGLRGEAKQNIANVELRKGLKIEPTAEFEAVLNNPSEVSQAINRIQAFKNIPAEELAKTMDSRTMNLNRKFAQEIFRRKFPGSEIKRAEFSKGKARLDEAYDLAEPELAQARAQLAQVERSSKSLRPEMKLRKAQLQQQIQEESKKLKTKPSLTKQVLKTALKAGAAGLVGGKAASLFF